MLTALLLTLAGLVVLAIAAVPLSRIAWGAWLVHGGVLLAALVLTLGGLAGLLSGQAAPVQRLPLSIPGLGPALAPGLGAGLLALDALSAWFLLALGLAAACSTLFALGHAGPHAPRTPARLLAAWPMVLAGMALTLLAADGFTLLLGFETMSLAAWILIAADHQRAATRHAARLYLGFAAFGAACLVPAFGLLGGLAGDLSFAAIRAAPPQGWLAAAVLALVVAGAGSSAGLLLPLGRLSHPVGLSPHAAAPSHVAALMSGGMDKVALYVLARVLLDLGGPAQPLWWGVPLLVLGAASAVLGALRANLEDDARAVLACSTIQNAGLIAIGLGLASCFRAADLGGLAALAAGAALLHVLAHAMFGTLLVLGLGEVQNGAASRRLDRLGGLIHAMPWTAAAVLVGVGAAASLPPLSGFASLWLLLQALLAAWRVGDLAMQVLGVAVVAAVALAVALAAAAMVRLFGLVFLGRPRTPRAAGAVDGPMAARWALLLPAGLTVLIGLLPGKLLDLASGAVLVLAPLGVVERGTLAMVRVGDGGARYWPIAVAMLLAGFGALIWWAVRLRAPAGVARSPAWDGGFMAPPQHLPFGDPLTQPSAAGFAQPLRHMLGTRLLGAREAVDMPAPAQSQEAGADPGEGQLPAAMAQLRDAVVAWADRLRRMTPRQYLMLSFATLVLLLALSAWLEGG